MPHRSIVNAAFDEAQLSAKEAGLSDNALAALDRMRGLFTEFVYTATPTITVFPSRKQIKVYCSNELDPSPEFDGTFESTIEDSGNIFLIAKRLNSEGSSETRQWMFSVEDYEANLNSHYWLAFVKLPEPRHVQLTGNKMEWDFIYPIIELNKYDGPLDFYGINLVTNQRIYVRMCDMEEMDHTRYYDVYLVPSIFYYLARIKHGLLSFAFKIMPNLYSKIHAWYIGTHDDKWYEKNNSFPDRWFKKIAWTKY